MPLLSPCHHCIFLYFHVTTGCDVPRETEVVTAQKHRSRTSKTFTTFLDIFRYFNVVYRVDWVHYVKHNKQGFMAQRKNTLTHGTRANRLRCKTSDARPQSTSDLLFISDVDTFPFYSNEVSYYKCKEGRKTNRSKEVTELKLKKYKENTIK